MNRSKWESDFEDQLEVEFQSTSESEFKNKKSFLDSKWEGFKAEQDEISILNYENKQGG